MTVHLAPSKPGYFTEHSAWTKVDATSGYQPKREIKRTNAGRPIQISREKHGTQRYPSVILVVVETKRDSTIALLIQLVEQLKKGIGHRQVVCVFRLSR